MKARVELFTFCLVWLEPVDLLCRVGKGNTYLKLVFMAVSSANKAKINLICCRFFIFSAVNII